MPVTFLPGSYAAAQNLATIPSISVANAVASQAGDCLLVFVWANTTIGGNGTYFSRDAANISDSAGNTYKWVGYNVAGSAQGIVLVAENIKAAAAGANIVTAVFDALNPAPGAVIVIMEYTGQVSCTCASSESGTSGQSYTAGNLITQAANEVMVSFSWAYTNASLVPSSGTSRGQISLPGAGDIGVADLVAASSGTNASVTFTTAGVSGANFTIAVSLSTAPYPVRSLSPLPPMGYDTWRLYAAACTEANAHAQADKMKSLGFIGLGYTLFNVSDVVYNTRTGGNLVVNSSLFPSGDAALFNYIRSDGLTPATYLGPGTSGCGGFPGSQGYESTDAAKILGLGAKYLMYDACQDFVDGGGTETQYNAMANVLDPSIIYMVSCPLNEWGAGSEIWGPQVRGDIICSAKDLGTMTWSTFITQLQYQVYRCLWITKGRWNWPDFLGVGNGNLTDAEGRTNMALWCVLAAPIWIACDLTTASAATLATLQNKDLIAIDQDSGGFTPFRASSTMIGSDTVEVWMRPLSGNRWAAVLSNQGSVPHSITVNWSMFGQSGQMYVYDCWAHTSLGQIATGYTASVASHDNAALILSFQPYPPPVQPSLPPGNINPPFLPVSFPPGPPTTPAWESGPAVFPPYNGQMQTSHINQTFRP